MATIVKRGRYEWQVKIRRKGYKSLGKTFESRADAEKWAHMVEIQIARGEWFDRTEGESTLIRDALERYAREITPRKAIKAQRRELFRIKLLQRSSIAHIALARVRGGDVSELISERKKQGANPNTIRLDLALLSHLYTVGRSEWRMEYLTNPVSAVRGARPKLPQGRNRRLQDKEEAKLLKAARKRSVIWESLIIVALETAMRRGEFADLRWEFVNLKTKVAHLPETKTEEARDVPLSPRALDALRALPRRIDGSVFGITDVNISQEFGEIRNEAGCLGLTFHDLRHEATSRLFERGYGIHEVRAITGHKNLATLSRYTHILATDIAKKMAHEKR